MAAVPNIVPVRSLKPANALVAGSGTWALTFGAMVVSIMLLHIGAFNMYLTSIGMYFAATIILLSIKLNRDEDSNNKEL